MDTLTLAMVIIACILIVYIREANKIVNKTIWEYAPRLTFNGYSISSMRGATLISLSLKVLQKEKILHLEKGNKLYHFPNFFTLKINGKLIPELIIPKILNSDLTKCVYSLGHINMACMNRGSKYELVPSKLPKQEWLCRILVVYASIGNDTCQNKFVTLGGKNYTYEYLNSF